MSWCWWCCHAFDGEPLQMPRRHDPMRNKFTTQGHFCSWSCMKAFAVDKFGVNAGSVGMSLFRLPGWLRDLGRSNLDKCYVLDMVNAHALILSRRHPNLVRLREYVDRREEVMASIPAQRKDAKQLFIKMIYGGHWRSWCQKHDVEPCPPPRKAGQWCDL